MPCAGFPLNVDQLPGDEQEPYVCKVTIEDVAGVEINLIACTLMPGSGALSDMIGRVAYAFGIRYVQPNVMQTYIGPFQYDQQIVIGEDAPILWVAVAFQRSDVVSESCHEGTKK